MLVASLLAAAGLVLGPRRWVHAVWAAAACGGLLLTRTDTLGRAGWSHAGIFQAPSWAAFEADSAYQHIRVYDDVGKDSPDRKVRVVALDYLIHGYVDLGDPTYLNYDYERIYRDVARRYIGSRRRVSAFFLGGGSFTFPRWLLAEWPGSRAVVAEIDPLVVEANYRATGLPRDTPIRTIVMDARNAVEDLPSGQQFDFFFGDAFNDLSVPYHLTTVEFTRQVATHLAPDGAYMLNVIDNFESGLLLGSVVNTLQRVFRHVYVFCTEPDGVGQRRDTFVVAASKVPLSTAGFEPHHGTDFEGSLLTREDIVSLIRKSGGRVLTDDSAPVENLIAPIVRARTREER
jgi:spermidine synthase